MYKLNWIGPANVYIKHYHDVDVVKIGDFGLVKIPESTLTSFDSDFKWALNDPDLIRIGLHNYSMRHETYALTRLCCYILTGKININKQKSGAIKSFLEKGISSNKDDRFQSVKELLNAVNMITD